MPKKAAVSKTGKRLNMYIYDADMVKVRELVAFVAGQGDRVSDSLVIRAALRVAKADSKFLSAYREAASADQRYKSAD